jgi:hypothetical protein
VTASPSKLGRGDSTVITFTVTESRGSGTAGFVCEVSNPDGVVHIARKASTEWISGKASADFTYPNDFKENDIPCATTLKGDYSIQCYWSIGGYGVNGKTVSTLGKFTVD